VIREPLAACRLVEDPHVSLDGSGNQLRGEDHRRGEE
jgi:hypothetical protein